MSGGRWKAEIEALRSGLERQALRRLGDACEAAELAQEVIVRCIVRHPDERAPLLPYARTVMQNLLRRRWRDDRWTVPLDELEVEWEELPPGQESARLLAVDERGFDSVDDEELVEVLRAFTRRLPADLRSVCEARWFGGATYGEIARAHGIDETTARGRCHKGRVLLRRSPMVVDALGDVRDPGRGAPAGDPPGRGGSARPVRGRTGSRGRR